MRFSLLTLVLATLALGSGVGVFLLSGAWRKELTVKDPWAHELGSFHNHMVSPDGTRQLKFHQRSVKPSYEILEYSKDDGASGRVLFTLPANESYDFVDDETIIGSDITADNLGGTTAIHFLMRSRWRRRYPEWWWGHFYRPEVWGAIVFGALMLLSVARDRSQNRART